MRISDWSSDVCSSDLGWISWPAYDPERLGAVRVTRGGGSGVHGPGALAGTIEMVSADPKDIAGVRGRLAYGSRDGVDASAGLGTTLGSGFLSSEERRVGKECGSTGRSRWSPDPKKK